MAGALCCMLIPTMLNAQTIEVEVAPDVEAQGITLIQADAPEASKYLEHISSVNLTKSLHPYSIVLVNNSRHRVIATAVGFRWTDPLTGRSHHRSFAIDDFNVYPSQLKAGGRPLLYARPKPEFVFCPDVRYAGKDGPECSRTILDADHCDTGESQQLQRLDCVCGLRGVRRCRTLRPGPDEH